MTERSEKVTLDSLVVFQRGELNMETVINERRATVSDLVEALQAEGVLIKKDWCVHHGSWMSSEGMCFSNPQRTGCDAQPRLIVDPLVVPLGEDAE